MIFGGLMKLTLLDYPEKVACTLFTLGCNLRCPFCHNATLVTGHDVEHLTEEEVLAFLDKRKHVLEGMCLTGGEPLINNVEEIAAFLTKVKALGYLVKLDTNGFFPEKLRKLVSSGLVDYVAMDVKNSLSRYAETVGCAPDLAAMEQSVAYLKGGVVPYEFRMTVTGNHHDDKSVEELGQWLRSDSPLYLQKFVDSGDILDKTTYGCDEDTMRRYRDILLPYMPNVKLRGMSD